MSQSAARVLDGGTGGLSWKGLYKVGAAAALIAVVFFRRNFGTELVTFGGFGIFDVPAELPTRALEWFTLLHEDTLLGLVLFDLIDLVNYALLGLIFLALYGALRRAGKSAMVVATAFGFAGIAVYFASNQAFAMANLNDQYAAATTEAQRSMLLAAGEALLAAHNPGSIYQGTGIYMSLFLVLLAGLIISVVMLRSSMRSSMRSTVFNKGTAYAGIVANGVGLGCFVLLVFAPALVTVPFVISGPFRVLWYILIALGLLRLARRELDGIGPGDDG
jgi:hypothetical protein